MIGHMVRQIMESRGYVIDAQRVLTRFDRLFSSGSRYKRAPHPGMGTSKPGWAVWGTS
jgi:hypothetical protein